MLLGFFWLLGVCGGLGGASVTDSSELERPESLEIETRSSKYTLRTGLLEILGWYETSGFDKSKGDSEMHKFSLNLAGNAI